MACNNQNNKSITEIVMQIAEPLAKELNLEIWDIKFVKEGPQRYLRVFIDKPDGITLEDCENMSRALDEPLDEADPIPMSYCLEVCSPGIDRELTTDKHLTKFLNYEVKIKLIRPDENNEKELVGNLESFSKDVITLSHAEHGSLDIQRKNIAHINLNN